MATRIVNDKTGLELTPPYFQVQMVITRIDGVDNDGNVTNMAPVRNIKGDFSDIEIDEALDTLGASPLSEDEKTTPEPDSADPE